LRGGALQLAHLGPGAFRMAQLTWLPRFDKLIGIGYRL
jgi:hypothetical protein